MDIAEIINTLLYRHNCVIIPGFGGLVTDYAPAQIHTTQHIFLPPHKSIAFNRSLNSNDGLLIAEIAKRGGTSYEEAGLQLQHFVRQMESGLKNKGSFILPFVGKFYYDIEKNLQFKEEEHQNYLLPSFGLDEFIAQPVMRREEVVPVLEPLVIPIKKTKRANWVNVAAAVVIIALIAQVFIVSTDTSHFNIQQTGVYHFISQLFTSSNKSAPINKPTANKQNNSHRKDTVVQIVVFQNSSTHPIDTAAIVNNAINPDAAKAVADVIKTPETNNMATTVSKPGNPTTDGNYCLIFGCFKGNTASQVLINQLKVKGVDAKIVIEDSYKRIGISGFNSMDEAVTAMKKYHQQGIKDVWVMKK